MSGFSVQTSPVRPYYRVLDNHYHITLAEILTERHHISGHRIVRIWVHPEFRGRNLATILMNLLTNDADASVETLYFSPYICDFTTFDKTIPVSDQVKWLKKHGFPPPGSATVPTCCQIQ